MDFTLYVEKCDSDGLEAKIPSNNFALPHLYSTDDLF